MRSTFVTALETNPEVFKRTQEIEDLFALTFPQTSGQVGEENNEDLVLNSEVAYSLKYSFVDLKVSNLLKVGVKSTGADQTMFMNNIPALDRWLSPRPGGRGTIKTSKILISWAENNGIKPESPEFQRVMAKWAANFIKPATYFEIKTDAESFSSLGTYGVDINSCFRPRGEYSHHPIILASSLGNTYPTFTITLREKPGSRVTARCWGFIYDYDGSILVTNFYGENGSKFNTNIILSYIRDHAIRKDKKYDIQTNNATMSRCTVYTNGDSRLLTTPEAFRTISTSGVFPKLHNRIPECVVCKSTTNNMIGSKFMCVYCTEKLRYS